MPSRRNALLVSLASFLILAPGVLWGVPWCKTLVCADRILDGDVPYRDFWAMYAPGQFYAAALTFLVFGRELWIQGLAASAVVAACSGVFFGLVRSSGLSVRMSVITCAIFTAQFWKTSPEWSSYVPALLAILIFWSGFVRYLRGESETRLLRLGLFLGVAAIFKHDVAFYVALSASLALALNHVLAGDAKPASWISPVRAVARLAAGALIVALPVIVWLAFVAGEHAWRQLVVFPATEFRSVFGEPYPGLLPDFTKWQRWFEDLGDLKAGRAAFAGTARWAVCALPRASFLIGAVALVLRWKTIPHATRASALVWLCALPFFYAAAHVQQNTHLISMATLSLLLFALSWAVVSGALRKLLAFGLAAYAVAITVPPALLLYEAAVSLPASSSVSFDGARGVRYSGREAEYFWPIVDFVRENIAPDEKIYVGVTRHDAIVVGNQRFYYLSDRRPCTPYNELHPGWADGESIQREIIADLERNEVRCAVLWNFGWSAEVLDQIAEERKSFRSDLGATLLDEYLEREFDVIGKYWEYRLLWRKGVPVPARSE